MANACVVIICILVGFVWMLLVLRFVVSRLVVDAGCA